MGQVAVTKTLTGTSQGTDPISPTYGSPFQKDVEMEIKKV